MKDISSYTDQNELRQLMKNAQRLNRDDIYREAFKRLCDLSGENYDDPLHREFAATLQAYEELLTKKNGRTTKATRTRQKLAKVSIEQCLEDWANSKKATDGFKALVENGMIELTGEFLVTKYPERFTPKAVEAAQKRLGEIEQQEELREAFAKAGIQIEPDD